MADEGETATVRLQEITPLSQEQYLPHELDAIGAVDDWHHFVAVTFRVRMGRDAFPVRVVMDLRQTPDDLLILEARKRAWTLLNAAADTVADHR